MLTLLTAGCSLNVSRPAVVKHYYLLDVSSEVSDAQPQFAVPIKVGSFDVAPPFAERGLVYRLGDERYESDFYNEFFVAPRAMVTGRIADWLAGRHLFAAALPPSSTLDAPYAIEGLVKSLYIDLSQENQPKAVFALQVFVTHTTGGERRIVLERLYAHEFALSDRSPDNLVNGLSQAFQLCLADLERDLRGMDFK